MKKVYLYEYVEFNGNDEYLLHEYFATKKERDLRIKERNWRQGTELNTIILPKQAYKLNHSTRYTKTDFKDLEKENDQLHKLLKEVKAAAYSIK